MGSAPSALSKFWTLGAHRAAWCGRSTSTLAVVNSRDDIPVLTSLEVMRRRPEMYMPEGIEGGGIASRLIDDAMLLGAKHVRVDVVAGWHIVSSPLDWLMVQRGKAVPIAELFTELRPLGAGRQNAVRCEPWVGAYSRAAYTVTPTEYLRVVGSEPLPDAVRLACCPAPCVRSIAYVMPDS